MVYYFTSTIVSPSVTLFMGFDKYENEDLIKWGWPEDVWFHVDKVSSAHVYLRLKEGQTIDDIPSAVLEDAAQLVKANSITGNKMNDVDIGNHREDGDEDDPENDGCMKWKWRWLARFFRMEIGLSTTSGVRKIRVAKRVNEIVNRLNKTKKEEHPDLRAEREARDAREREDKKRLQRELKEKQKEEERRKLEEAELRSYSTLMKPENMKSNKSNDGNDSDDFM
ncbi:unnamed protein product [Nezara viridula]|uniref:Coiled-coil domain-containing protein 25 n=1 Tax=Nezara viridula TaxID=85310 RepID=A0A9P0E017_NEZVI|nr:unnamed protein product [Nezara viridula]